MESGHIKEVRVNNISTNINYCFIMTECTPQEKLLDEPYTVSVCVHKQSGKIITAECQCPAGMSKVCKYVGGLEWPIEVAVRKKERKTCTDVEQTWSKPSKMSIKLHQSDEIASISMKKVKPDMLSMENKKYIQLHDPRMTADRYPCKQISFGVLRFRH